MVNLTLKFHFNFLLEIQPIVLLTKIDKVYKYEPLLIEDILDSGAIKDAL